MRRPIRGSSQRLQSDTSKTSNRTNNLRTTQVTQGHNSWYPLSSVPCRAYLTDLLDTGILVHECWAVTYLGDFVYVDTKVWVKEKFKNSVPSNNVLHRHVQHCENWHCRKQASQHIPLIKNNTIVLLQSSWKRYKTFFFHWNSLPSKMDGF